jgi:pyruvate formate lyase activating enzyme
MDKAVNPVGLQEMLRVIVSRRGFVDGVVITGGEPTMYSDLVKLAVVIKTMGFSVKLDTNGSNPDVLRVLLKSKIVDFIAMDIKTSWAKYRMAAGVKVDRSRLIDSVLLIKESHIDHEFRTTCVPRLVDGDDIEEISKIVGRSGNYTLQQFQPENTLKPEFSKITPYSKETLMSFRDRAGKNTAYCRLIGV